MIVEDYVSFETAKLLKEKGFDEPCKLYYDKYHGCVPIFVEDSKLTEYGYKELVRNDQNSISDFIASAPSLYVAMKWLREVHHLTIDVFHFRDWKVNIKTIPDDYFKADYSYPELKPAETYEQACEAAIKYCLKNLI